MTLESATIRFECPVCYWMMDEPASGYNICPRCGTEFENDDADATHEELRKAWIEDGCKFFFKAEKPADSPTFAYSQKDEVYAMLRPYLEPGTGETTIRAIWSLLVELVERRKSKPVEAEER